MKFTVRIKKLGDKSVNSNFYEKFMSFLKKKTPNWEWLKEMELTIKN